MRIQMTSSLTLVGQNTETKRVYSEGTIKTKRNNDLENGFINPDGIKEHDITGLNKFMIVEEDNSLDSDSDSDQGFIGQTN